MEEANEESSEELSDVQRDEDSLSLIKQRPVSIPYGFISKAKYEHKSKNCDIQSVTYNSKTGSYVIVDSRRITAWTKNIAVDKTVKLMEFPAYQFNVIKILLYCRKFNVYFALSKDYQLRVYNLNFHETFSVASDTNSVIHMLFNSEKDELITASRGELQFWSFGEISHCSDLLQAKYGLILSNKWEVADGRLINRIVLDENLQRLYCLSEKDIWCYDMSGKIVFKISQACSAHLSACAYSIFAHLLILGTIDGQINVLSTSGGNLHVFHSHVGLVTEILVHPSDELLVITSSLDGYVKIFSLDMFEELNSVKAFDEGIELMALRSNDMLYCASVKQLELFDLNYFHQFWGQLRYSAKRIELVRNAEKSTRVLALAEDGSVRLFACVDGRKLCTVLPPPSIDAMSKILDCVHDRDYNIVYLLVKDTEVWVYTTKTDPACHLAIINVSKERETRKGSKYRSSRLIDLQAKSDMNKCNCLEVLQNFIEVEFEDSNGVMQTQCNLLACGMDSGEIILYNPLRNGQKENTIKLCRYPIISMQYYKDEKNLILLIKSKEEIFIQMINDNLQCVASVSCCNDLTVFSLKNNILASGFESGHVLMLEFQKGSMRNIQTEKKLSDHHGSVLSVCFHPTLDIICSSGTDAMVKIWSTDKALLCDLCLDKSLTSACFLNNFGDVLIGFKSQIFIIRHQGKLEWLADTNQEANTVNEKESEIYESPYLRYDIKRPISPESENMENYLVPYQDMMFSTIGSWVAYQDDKDSDDDIAEAGNQAGVVHSDGESSYAPSDIYQSSIHSGSTRLSDAQWRLPECIVSSDESINLSDEDAEEDFIYQQDLDGSRVNEGSSRMTPVDAKSRLKMLLEMSENAKNGNKNTQFSHGASKKLNNTRIDSKRLKKTMRKTKNSRTELVHQDSVGLSMTSSAHQEPKKEARKIIKKTKKSIDGRGRVAHKQSRDDSKANKKDISGSDLEQVIENVSPDTGYHSRSSLSHETHQTVSEGKDDPEVHGMLISKERIQLKRQTLERTRDESLTDVVHKQVTIDEVEEHNDAKDAETEVDLYDHLEQDQESMKSPRSHSASSLRIQQFSCDNEGVMIPEQDSEAFDQGLSGGRPLTMSPASILSSIIFSSSDSDTVSITSSDSDLTSETSEDLMNVEVISREADSKVQSSLTFERSPAAKAMELQLKKETREVTKQKVIPAFSQQFSVTVDAGHKSHDQSLPMTVFSLTKNRSATSRASDRRDASRASERRDTESPTARGSRSKQQTPVVSVTENRNADIRKPKTASSKAIRIPVGEMMQQDGLLSSLSIRKSDQNKPYNSKEEQQSPKKESDLVNFCISALKHKKSYILNKTQTQRIPSANLLLNPTKEDNDFNRNDQRPLTAPANGSYPNKVNETEVKVTHKFNDQNSYVSDENKIKTAKIRDENAKEINDKYGSLDLQEDNHFSAEVLNIDNLLDKDEKELWPVRNQALNSKNLQFIVQPSETKSGIKTDVLKTQFAKYSHNSKDYETEIRSYQEADVSRNFNRRLKITKRFQNKVNTSETADKNSHSINQHHFSINKQHESFLPNQKQNLGDTDFSLDSTKDLDQTEDSELYKDDDYTACEKLHQDEEGKLLLSEGNTKERNFMTSRTNKIEEKLYKNLRRESSKSKLIFVNLPDNSDSRQEVWDTQMSVCYRQEVVSPVSQSSVALDMHSHVRKSTGEKSKVVPTLHEKLLKRRALNERSKERQTSAKFRKEVIDRQKLARAQCRSVSPSFSPDYAVEYITDPPESAEKPDVVYEYNRPVPLEANCKKINKGSRHRSLEARMSGQPFRHGQSYPNDANEDFVLDFIKCSMRKGKKDITLLPRPKSSPSIPAKCHQYVLVTEKEKQKPSLTKLERELLNERFNNFSLEVT